MSTQGPQSSKPRTPTSQWQGSPKFSSASSNSSSYAPISSHMAMVELKQNILASVSKLADRDTYEIAVSDLESTIQTISQDAIPMLLNCLFDSSNHPKPAVRKESIRLLALVCTTRGDSMLNHLTKIITHVSRWYCLRHNFAFNINPKPWMRSIHIDTLHCWAAMINLCTVSDLTWTLLCSDAFSCFQKL